MFSFIIDMWKKNIPVLFGSLVHGSLIVFIPNRIMGVNLRFFTIHNLLFPLRLVADLFLLKEECKK